MAHSATAAHPQMHTGTMANQCLSQLDAAVSTGFNESGSAFLLRKPSPTSRVHTAFEGILATYTVKGVRGDVDVRWCRGGKEESDQVVMAAPAGCDQWRHAVLPPHNQRTR